MKDYAKQNYLKGQEQEESNFNAFTRGFLTGMVVLAIITLAKSLF